MGRQIIKQLNGKYCIFSSIVDNIIHYNLTEEEIVKIKVEEATERIKLEVKRAISDIEIEGNPYRMTLNELLETVKGNHGKKEMKIIKRIITSITP